MTKRGKEGRGEKGEKNAIIRRSVVKCAFARKSCQNWRSREENVEENCRFRSLVRNRKEKGRCLPQDETI